MFSLKEHMRDFDGAWHDAISSGSCIASKWYAIAWWMAQQIAIYGNKHNGLVTFTCLT